jgi:hypothetical protein
MAALTSFLFVFLMSPIMAAMLWRTARVFLCRKWFIYGAAVISGNMCWWWSSGSFTELL